MAASGHQDTTSIGAGARADTPLLGETKAEAKGLGAWAWMRSKLSGAAGPLQEAVVAGTNTANILPNPKPPSSTSLRYMVRTLWDSGTGREVSVCEQKDGPSLTNVTCTGIEFQTNPAVTSAQNPFWTPSETNSTHPIPLLSAWRNWFVSGSTYRATHGNEEPWTIQVSNNCNNSAVADTQFDTSTGDITSVTMQINGEDISIPKLTNDNTPSTHNSGSSFRLGAGFFNSIGNWSWPLAVKDTIVTGLTAAAPIVAKRVFKTMLTRCLKDEEKNAEKKAELAVNFVVNTGTVVRSFIDGSYGKIVCTYGSTVLESVADLIVEPDKEKQTRENKAIVKVLKAGANGMKAGSLLVGFVAAPIPTMAKCLTGAGSHFFAKQVRNQGDKCCGTKKPESVPMDDTQRVPATSTSAPVAATRTVLMLGS